MNVPVAIALAIAFLATPKAHAAGAFPFEALPKLTDQEHLEAVVFIDDLRALRGTLQIQRAYLERARFGKDYFSAEHLKSVYGVDLYGEIDHLLALAAPNGAPVPIAGFISSAGAGLYHGQIAIKVESGVADRLSHDTSGLFKITPDGKTFDVGGQAVAFKVDGDWLRIGPEDNDLTFNGTQPSLPAFSDTVTRWSKDAQLVVAVIGGGELSKQLIASASTNPVLQNLIQTTRAAALTMRWDADLSQVMRIVVDSDSIGQMAPMIRRSDMTESSASGWDDQAMTAIALSLPPMAVTTAMTLAQMQLGDNKDPMLQDLAKAVESLDGTLSFAAFGAPSDWAVSAECSDAQAASSFVTTIHQTLQKLVDKYQVEPGLIAIKSDKGGPPVLTLRPDVKLSETTWTSHGKSVVIARQRMRADRLAKLHAGKKGKSLLDGPLTPAVREVLARPAIIQAYAISGYDGTLLDWLYWPAKLAEIALKNKHDVIPAGSLDSAALGGNWTAGAINGAAKFSRLPLSLAMGAFGLATTYDYAASLDVDGNALVFQFAGSQL